MTEKTSSRLAGVFFILLGVALLVSVEHEANTEATYGVKAAFLGPFAVVLGLGFLIHAPSFPIRGGRRETAYSVVATLCGLLNLQRYGAFSEGSEARTPVLFGIGAVAVYSLYEWVKKRKKA